LVEARSDGPSQGSEFPVRLPVARDDKARENRRMAGDRNNIAPRPKQRILVVDDNRDSVDSLALMLRMIGNEVCTAHDGVEAVDAAVTFNPEVILLDIGLPRLNGFDAARRIRGRWAARKS
jgi:PleD family two-component response regulator